MTVVAGQNISKMSLKKKKELGPRKCSSSHNKRPKMRRWVMSKDTGSHVKELLIVKVEKIFDAIPKIALRYILKCKINIYV